MIEAENLGKTFDEFTAVSNLSINVPAGQLLALLGPNRAGKTTTVRMIGAILKPTTGSATVNGFDVEKQADKVRRSIGMLTEQPGLYLRMSGLEYLLYYGRLYGMRDEQTRQRGQEMFAHFGMKGDEFRRLGTYSKGMQQKVGLIRAMLHDPAVLLLDEPTSAMDPHSAKLVRDAIRELRNDKRTIVLCTHNLAEAEALADEIAIVQDGTIVAQNTPNELKDKLLGKPQMEVRLNKPLNGEVKVLQDLVTIDVIEDKIIRYRTDDPERINPQLVSCLMEMGLGVVALQEVPQSLEDVYLRVVQDGNRKNLSKNRKRQLAAINFPQSHSRESLRMTMVVVRREVRDSFRDWRIIIPIFLLTLIFPWLMNFTAGRLVNFVEDYGAEIIANQLVPFLLLVVGFFPHVFFADYCSGSVCWREGTQEYGAAVGFSYYQWASLYRQDDCFAYPAFDGELFWYVCLFDWLVPIKFNG